MAVYNTKSTYSRAVHLVGVDSNFRVGKIPRVICFRKGMPRIEAKAIMKRNKHAIGFVSSPGLHLRPNAGFCKFWCHCYKNDEVFKVPNMLLSESDFVDPRFITVYKRPETFKYDFCYFTSGGKAGTINKGIDIFARSLPILCGQYQMRGIVIKYMKGDRPFVPRSQKVINKYSDYLTIKGKRLSPKAVAKIMAKSRFSFFPNTADCSPLLLAESLVRDCPALVNENILGGWKYINENTGATFNLGNLSDQIETMLSSPFSPSQSHLQQYGFMNSATRWANALKEHMKMFRKYHMVAFATDSPKLRKIRDLYRADHERS